MGRAGQRTQLSCKTLPACLLVSGQAALALPFHFLDRSVGRQFQERTLVSGPEAWLLSEQRAPLEAQARLLVPSPDRGAQARLAED